jgi:hypothetical protein
MLPNTHPPTVENPSPEQKRFNPQHLQKLPTTLNPHPIASTKYNSSKIQPSNPPKTQTHRSTNLGPKIHYQPTDKPTGPPKSTIKPTGKLKTHHQTHPLHKSTSNTNPPI